MSSTISPLVLPARPRDLWQQHVGVAFKRGRLGIAWPHRFLLLIETGRPRCNRPWWGLRRDRDESGTIRLGLGWVHVAFWRGNIDMPFAHHAAEMVQNPARIIG